MIDISPELGDTRRWIVCAGGTRWLTAVRRFVPAMMPSPLVPSIQAADAERVGQLLLGQGPAAVLLEVRHESMATACQYLAQTAISLPGVLQLLADGGLSDRERLVLAEFPIAAMIRHPEELPRLKPMVQGHFAAARQDLD